MDPYYECDNCDWTTSVDTDFPPLSECEGLVERLDTGSTVPAGECPECHCFVYRVDLAERKRDNADQLYDALSSLSAAAGEAWALTVNDLQVPVSVWQTIADALEATQRVIQRVNSDLPVR